MMQDMYEDLEVYPEDMWTLVSKQHLWWNDIEHVHAQWRTVFGEDPVENAEEDDQVST